ncbi:MAG: tetratricopeptide repeat protein [Alphaproteobacteria bacterium]|nr:tetratricopeptide repeat protein [Alphaproteobacteria bacterium]
MQPFKSMLLALALVGCASQDNRPTTLAPAPSSLYSEFSANDAGETVYGPFVAATLAQHDERFASAAKYYLDALAADPSSDFVADRAFFQLLYAGRVDEAARISLQLQDAEVAKSDDLIRLMYVLEAFKREDWQEVRQRLGGVKEAGFGFLISPLLEAWSYAAESNVASARDALAGLVADQRLGVIGKEHLAYVLDHTGQIEEAGDAYLALLADGQPSSLQPLVAYAGMLQKAGRTEDARNFLGEQTKKYPDSRYLLREGMRIMAGYGPSQEVTAPRGAAGQIFYRLATEFAQGQSNRAAVIYLRVASYLTPEVSEIYFLLGNLLERLDTYEAAASAYASVPSTSELSAVANLRRIEALRLAGHEDDAEERVRRVLKDMPNSTAHLSLLADMLRDKEEFGEAVHYYNRAIEQIRNPGKSDWFVFFARGISLEQLGRWADAERDLRAALALNPGEPSVLNYLGYSWIDRGERIEEAKKMIEQAVEEMPEDGFIVDSLGWVHYLTGDYDQAVLHLERAVRLQPTDPTINDHLGDAYWRVGRKIEARFQWRHALENDPEEEDRQAISDKIAMGLPDAS